MSPHNLKACRVLELTINGRTIPVPEKGLRFFVKLPKDDEPVFGLHHSYNPNSFQPSEKGTVARVKFTGSNVVEDSLNYHDKVSEGDKLNLASITFYLSKTPEFENIPPENKWFDNKAIAALKAFTSSAGKSVTILVHASSAPPKKFFDEFGGKFFIDWEIVSKFFSGGIQYTRFWKLAVNEMQAHEKEILTDRFAPGAKIRWRKCRRFDRWEDNTPEALGKQPVSGGWKATANYTAKWVAFVKLEPHEKGDKVLSCLNFRDGMPLQISFPSKVKFNETFKYIGYINAELLKEQGSQHGFPLEIVTKEKVPGWLKHTDRDTICTITPIHGKSYWKNARRCIREFEAKWKRLSETDVGMDLNFLVKSCGPSRLPPKKLSPEALQALDCLDEYQRQAAITALESPSGFAVIQGAAGTGKSRVGMALVEAQIKMNQGRVLYTAHDNSAVDTALDSHKKYLVGLGYSITRVHAPSRVGDPENPHKEISLQAKAIKLGKEDLAKLEQAKKNPILATTDFYRRHDEIQYGRYEQILQNTDAAYLTWTACGIQVIRRHLSGYTTLIIDEGTRADEVSFLLGASLESVTKIIFLGDSKQLGPFKHDVVKQLSIPPMSRLMENNIEIGTLRYVYRCHPDILKFINEQFYNNTLIAHPSTSTNPISEWVLDVAERAFGMRSASIWSPTEGAEEYIWPSYMNRSEAIAVQKIVERLRDFNVPLHMITIIAMYSEQAGLIQEALPGAKVNTVDSAQGTENAIVITSLVRCNADRKKGFIRDPKRLAVMLSRPRNLRILVGNIENFYDLYNEDHHCPILHALAKAHLSKLDQFA